MMKVIVVVMVCGRDAVAVVIHAFTPPAQEAVVDALRYAKFNGYPPTNVGLLQTRKGFGV
ncbi:hypothetical protein CASFOL_031501 [Castilleja foliolosa]|uniref:Uncharacterized protein n=1 Tax=Castilleja foliolosa TaxID=1961234 RepID=A0ABD3C4W6_9LAMI